MIGHTGASPSASDRAAMDAALAQAEHAASDGEIPVGAAVVGPTGEILAAARNVRENDPDPSGHAEILAIRAAAHQRGDRILDDCTLVVTLEPCVMCAGVILAARIPRVVFGAWDEKAGAVGSVYDLLRDGRLPHPVPEVVAGVRAEECAALLRDFFAARRHAPQS